MTHISRPFQIALAAMLLFAAVWFVALRGHSSGTESSGSAASSSAPAAAPQASGSSSGAPSGGSSGASSPDSTYHGSAPGVAGLTRAIAKARGAAAQSEQSAQQLQRKSAGATHAQATPSGADKTHALAPAVKPAGAAPGAKTHARRGVPAMQLKIESQLKQGKVVAVLFWNPKGAVDAVVRRALQAASRAFAGKLAVHVARSSQVGSFGAFTRTVQVYGTPTILMINTKGVTSSVPGLKDAFSIEQAVREVQRAR
jgi:hypothetical protein